MFRLTTFGGLALSRDGEVVTGAAAQRSRLTLLSLLATAGPAGFSRDKVLLHLWPEADEDRARHALKQSVYSIRRELGADDIIVGTASLSLNPTLITSDVREFEAAIAAGDLAGAVALYTGPFLDGVHLKDSAEFDRWSSEERARYSHMWTAALEQLAAACESRGAWREAAGHWRRLAASEPLSGRFALALIRCLAESGDLGAALQQYRIHEALLREEIGSEPEQAVKSLAEELRTGTWQRSPDVMPLVTATGPRSAARQPTGSDTPRSDSPVPADQLTGADTAPADSPARASNPAHRTGITQARRRRRRATAIAFALGALLVAVVALGVSYARIDPQKRATLSTIRSRGPSTLEPHRIVVAPFENKTGDSAYDVLGEQIADWLAGELTEADFEAVDSRTARYDWEIVSGIPRLFRNRDKDIAFAEENRSAWVVGGRLYLDGGRLKAFVSVKDVAAGETRMTDGPFYGSPAAPESLIVALLPPTMMYLQKSVDTTAGGLTVAQTSPPSLEAYERVSRAWERFFDTPNDTTPVFAALDSAIALDSTYAAPLLMKAYILDVKSQWAGVESIVRRIRRLRPKMSRLESAAFDLFEADLRGDQFHRLAIARRLRELSPASGEIPLLVVVSALYTGRTAEAVAALKAVDPDRGMNLVAPAFLEWSAEAYHAAANFAEERRVAERSVERFHGHPATTTTWVRVLATSNDKELSNVVDRGIPRRGQQRRDSILDRLDLLLIAGREQRAHGHAGAARYFSLAAAEAQRIPLTAPTSLLRRVAHVHYEAANWTRAREAFAELSRRDTMDVESLGRLATSALRAGDQATASQIDRKLAALDRPFLMGSHVRWRANIAGVAGRDADALALLESAVRQGHRLFDTPLNLTVHLDGDYRRIVASPEWGALLRKFSAVQ